MSFSVASGRKDSLRLLDRSFAAFGLFGSIRKEDVPLAGACVSVGVFDGVHKGHRRIISVLMRKAQEIRSPSVIITFSQNPKDAFCRNGERNIMSVEERRRTLLSLGIGCVLELDFNEDVRRVGGSDFARWLFSKRISFLVAGRDFRCGNPSDSADMGFLAREYPGKVIAVDDVMFAGERISSSIIRDIIRRKGRLDEDDRRNYEVETLDAN